jgi:hypothetical protein
MLFLLGAYVYKFAADLKREPKFLLPFHRVIIVVVLFVLINSVISSFYDGQSAKTNIRRFWGYVISLKLIMIFSVRLIIDLLGYIIC